MSQLLGTRRRVVLLAAIVAVLAVLGGVAAASGDGGDGGRPLVITAEAQRRTLTDSLTVKGTVGRAEQRQVEAATAAQVTDVAVADGAEIAAGSALLSLDGRASIAEDGEFPFFRPLDVGSRGEDVRQLETILRREGFDPGRINDIYDESTRAALAQWQARHRYPGPTPERAETVTVSLTPSSGYTVGDRSAAGVTIRPSGAGVATSGDVVVSNAVLEDDDVVFELASTANPTLSIHSLAAAVPEGTVASFRIDADDVPIGDTEVTLELVSGSANDVVAPVGTVTLAAGAWSATVTVPTRQDLDVERDETLELRLVDGAGYSVDSGHDEASTTIVDDDVPELTITGGGRTDEGGTATVTVVADQAPRDDLQVSLTTTGDAVAGKDYRSLEPFVVLPAGDKSVGVTVSTLTDDTLENDERIVVALAASATHYRVGPAGAAVVTIAQAVGDDALPQVRLRATATSVKEGLPFPLTVTLDRPLGDELVLDLSYAGTAVDGDDFTPVGRVAMPAGQTSLALQVPTVQDDRVEDDRQLVVSLLPSARYRLGVPAGGAATIESDDLPELTLVAGRDNLGEGGATTFRIVADQAPVRDISVSYSAVGSATPGEDFDALAGTAVLPAGQTELAVPLLTLADDIQFQPTDMIVGHWPIRVGQVLVDEGAAVAAGAPLLSLTDSSLTVTLHASASDRTRLQPGQKATVTLSGSSDSAEGVVTELDETAQVDEKTKEQFYEGTVDAAGLAAADGANVSIEVVLDQRDNALTVPIAAVKQNGSGEDVVRVLELDRGGKIREVKVRVGLTEGSYIEVTSGLRGGEVVIVEVDDQQ